MKGIINPLIVGAAGAITVTLLHEIVRSYYGGAPRLDLLGEEALQKTIEGVSGSSPSSKSLYFPTMAADLVSNTIYYSGAGFTKGHPLAIATALGFAAGLGAVALPDKMNLDNSTTDSTPQRRWITIGLYTIGGLITGLILQRQRSGIR